MKKLGSYIATLTFILSFIGYSFTFPLQIFAGWGDVKTAVFMSLMLAGTIWGSWRSAPIHNALSIFFAPVKNDDEN